MQTECIRGRWFNVRQRKHITLISLHKDCGWYAAVCYDSRTRSYQDYRFLYYNKKAVISALRQNYGVVVPRCFS